MPRVGLEVLSGTLNVPLSELAGDVIRIGRAPHNEVSLSDVTVSSEHARITLGASDVTLEDLGSSNGTFVIRGEIRQRLDEGQRFVLQDADTIELGAEEQDTVRVRVSVGDEEEPQNIVELRPIAALKTHSGSAERNVDLLEALSTAQRAVSRSVDLSGTAAAVLDAALGLISKANHATLVLKDPTLEQHLDGGFVPFMTRVRDPEGRAVAPEKPVRIARSIFRKVVRERAALLATDVPGEEFSSESLLGASIESTLAVPLFRDDEVLGVLQLDSRGAPALFTSDDLETLGILATNASLAVDNARLISRLKSAEAQLQKELTFLKDKENARRGLFEIIGQSSAMKRLLDQVDKVVNTRVSVLIEGATGTGKELIASAIHHRSKRRERLFVAQNCAALPENLLESELFGHKRGAFTGATEEKRGLFDVADRGTLFLDEVTEMPLALQAKLLRVLQEGEIRPVGASSAKYVDVRIVAATNRNLEAEVKEGRFREDLYYRLKVFPLRVPPLAERREDIPLLANHFLQRYSKEFGKATGGLSQTTVETLSAYDWPGNVRELENEIQRLLINVEPEAIVTPDLLSPRVRQVETTISQAGVSKGTLKEMTEQVERYLLAETLREHNNNKTSAAKALGITREGLHKKLRQLKMS